MPLKCKQSPSAKIRHQNLPSKSERHNSKHEITHQNKDTNRNNSQGALAMSQALSQLGIAYPQIHLILTMTLIIQQKGGTERFNVCLKLCSSHVVVLGQDPEKSPPGSATNLLTQSLRRMFQLLIWILKASQGTRSPWVEKRQKVMVQS